MDTDRAVHSPTSSHFVNHWQTLFEAVLQQSDSASFEQNLQAASAAIVDQLNSPHPLSERGLLLAALRKLSDVERERALIARAVSFYGQENSTNAGEARNNSRSQRG